MQRQERKTLLTYIIAPDRPANTKPYLLSPSLTLILDNKFIIYAGLSCPSAWCNKIMFGHWQTAHHGRTPEVSVCELCVAALVRHTQDRKGRRIYGPLLCVCVISC